MASTYRRLLADAGLEPGPVASPVEPIGGRHTYNQFVVRCDRRDELLAHLKDAGVASQVYYPVPLHLQECFAALGGRPGDLPEAERAARETLALPIYPELTEEMQITVVKAISGFFS